MMADSKKCGFKHWLPCTEECDYFNTCTRNPHKKDIKDGGKSNGRKKDVYTKNHRQ